MAGGSDEVETGVHPQVGLLVPLGLLLLAHVRFMLVVDKLDNGGPGVAVVDVVAKPGRVNDSELDLELLLLQLGLDDLDLGELVELLVVALAVVFRGRELGGEKGVDERRLPETGFTWSARSARAASSMPDDAPTTIIVKCAPRFATILCFCKLRVSNGCYRVRCTTRTWLGRLAIPMPSWKGAGEVIMLVLNDDDDDDKRTRRDAAQKSFDLPICLCLHRWHLPPRSCLLTTTANP